LGELLPGEFAIQTEKKNFLSASYNKYTGTRTVITSATTLGPAEKFKLTVYAPGYALIQSADGYFVTVSPEGGITLSQSILENSLFTLKGPDPEGFFFILTRNGPFLAAVDGGGQTSNAFITDGSGYAGWQFFSILKSGDLGSGYRYAIRPRPALGGDSLSAPGGGGNDGAAALGAPVITTGISSDGIFTPVWLPGDGAYALQTADGFNFVTAVDGGGLANGDNLHTDATRVEAWEKFKIVDQGDATYTIQTVSGFFLGVDGAAITTRVSSPDDAPQVGYTARFEFIMIPNQFSPSAVA
jgi:hypothetical protein